MESKSLKNLTCKSFFMCMNISFVISLSQLYDTRIGYYCFIVLTVLGVISFFLHYIRYAELKVSSIIFTIIAFVIGAAAYVMSKSPTLLKMIIFIYALQGVDKKNILKYCIQSLLIGFGIVALSSLVGITDMMYVSNMKMAYRFGLSNPNTVPVIFFAVITAYNLQNDENLTYKTLIIEGVLSWIVYYFSKGRTFLVVFFVYLVALAFVKCLRKTLFIRAILWPFQYSFFLFAGVSYYVAAFFRVYDYQWLQINSLLTGRLYAWNGYLDCYGISTFGNRLDGSLYGAFDNAYLQLLVKYGWVTFVLYAGMFIVISRYAFSKRNWILLVTIIMYQVYFLAEFAPMLINFCTVLLVFAYVLFDVYSKGKVPLKTREKR